MDDEDLFSGGLYWFGEDASCFCGNYWCDTMIMTAAKQPVHGSNEELVAMHSALETQNGAQVCQLLRSGMHLCCNSQHNCFISIIKLWKCPVLDSALRIYPSAVNSHGAGGYTLPMLCESLETLKVVLKHGPDLNAVNDSGDNLLLHAVKHRLRHFSRTFQDLFDYGWDIDFFLKKDNVKNMLKECKSMTKCIVTSGVNLNCVDATGETALQVVLNLFKCGYVFTRFDDNFDSDTHDWHNGEFCFINNQLASYALAQLLNANAAIPSPDDFGRTAFMKAAFGPYNTENMKMMMERGIDITAKDQNGFNAMFYLLSSFTQHCFDSCWLTIYTKSSDIAEMTALLLANGCDLQGQHIMIRDPLHQNITFDDNNGWYCKVLSFLLTVKESKLNQLDFPQKHELKNDPEDNEHNFFNLYLIGRMSWWKFEMNDVFILKEEISNGTPVFRKWFQQTFDISEWWGVGVKLHIPDAIWRLLQCQLRISNSNFDMKNISKDILEEMQKLLLPFWNLHPLALALFPREYKSDLLFHHTEYMRLLEFLYDFGGPLSPGSKLYLAVEKKFKSLAQRCLIYVDIHERFVSLHAEVPSLQQLSRTALRGSFKIGRTDTEGLDLSSLRIQWQEEMRELPRPIKDFINLSPDSIF